MVSVSDTRTWFWSYIWSYTITPFMAYTVLQKINKCSNITWFSQIEINFLVLLCTHLVKHLISFCLEVFFRMHLVSIFHVLMRTRKNVYHIFLWDTRFIHKIFFCDDQNQMTFSTSARNIFTFKTRFEMPINVFFFWSFCFQD